MVQEDFSYIAIGSDVTFQRLLVAFRYAGLKEFFNQSTLKMTPVGVYLPFLTWREAHCVANRMFDMTDNSLLAKSEGVALSELETDELNRSYLDDVLGESHTVPVGYTRSIVKVTQ